MIVIEDINMRLPSRPERDLLIPLETAVLPVHDRSFSRND